MQDKLDDFRSVLDTVLVLPENFLPGNNHLGRVVAQVHAAPLGNAVFLAFICLPSLWQGSIVLAKRMASLLFPAEAGRLSLLLNLQRPFQETAQLLLETSLSPDAALSSVLLLLQVRCGACGEQSNSEACWTCRSCDRRGLPTGS